MAGGRRCRRHHPLRSTPDPKSWPRPFPPGGRRSIVRLPTRWSSGCCPSQKLNLGADHTDILPSRGLGRADSDFGRDRLVTSVSTLYVDNVTKFCPRLPAHKIVSEDFERSLHIACRTACDVGGNNDVLHRPQRAVLRKRLDLKYIKCGARDPPLLQRRDESLLIDYSSSSNIDKKCGWSHQGKLPNTDHSACFRGFRHCQNNDVAFRKKAVQFRRRKDLLDPFDRTRMTLETKNAKSGVCRTHRNNTTNTSEANYAKSQF